MDVIIIYPLLFQKGGADRVVLEIAKKFNPIIYSVIYNQKNTFQEFKEFDIRIPPKTICEIPFSVFKKDIVKWGSMVAGVRYLSQKIKEDYDLINAQGSPANWIREKNERVSWYCHSPIRSATDLYQTKVASLPLHKKLPMEIILSTYLVIESRIVPKLEQIITNSEVTNERIKKYLKRNDAKVIHPGVDIKEFQNSRYEKYFLYPSRFAPEKRFEYVIEAFRLFSSKNKGWKLVLAGFLPKREREQKYLDQLKALSSGLNIEFKIDINDKKLKKLYATSYTVLFSAINEDWGLIPLEAMASEKPCISVNEGGPTYSIINGKTGYLVNSQQEMAQKMLFLANNPDENERLGKEGRKRVLKNYTWKIFLDNIERAFKEVAKTKSRCYS